MSYFSVSATSSLEEETNTLKLTNSQLINILLIASNPLKTDFDQNQANVYQSHLLFNHMTEFNTS